MKTFLLFFSVLCPVILFSQNLTGTWIGSSGMSYVKLVVIQQGDSLYGYTYDEGPGFCKASFSGIYRSDDNVLKGKGIEMLKNSGSHGLGVYNLSYSKNGEDEYLRGTVAAKNFMMKVLSMGIASPIQLKKYMNEIDTIAYMHKRLAQNKPSPIPELKKQEPVPVVLVEKKVLDTKRINIPTIKVAPVASINEQKKQRASKIVDNISTGADTVKMYVYDNGEVDNDSVTIFFDNVVILDKYRITDKAKELFLPLTRDGKIHTIELFANNLGSIPPNTALIILMAGKKRYELRTSYDLQTNAQINIRFQE